MNALPETPEQKYNRIYKELYVLFHREQLTLDIVATLAEDLIISCAISAHNGNQTEAGESLKTYFIPDIADKIARLIAGKYPVVQITERDTALDSLDVTTLKPH